LALPLLNKRIYLALLMPATKARLNAAVFRRLLGQNYATVEILEFTERSAALAEKVVGLI
jgi:hypothetical protein